MKRLNDILRITRYEYQSILHSLPILVVLGGGIFLYGILYNYMYSPNVLRDVPVVVVDESQTPLSRHYIRLLDATPQVRVQGIITNMPEARKRMKETEVAGILSLPADFDAKVGRGEEAVFVSFNNTMAFLSYAALKEAFSGAMLALDDSVRPYQMVFLNPNVVQPVINTPSIQVQGIALYNESGGYATYLIPAVLMVIIFQTMVMVISMRCGKENEQRMRPLLGVSRHDSFGGMAINIVIGKSVVYVGFYALFAIFLLGLLPLVFDLPHLASPLLLIQLMIPFLPMLEQILLLLGLPIVLGLLFAHFFPKATKIISKPLQVLSVLLFVGMVVVSFAQNFQIFIDNIFYVFFIVMLHNMVALATGLKVQAVSTPGFSKSQE